MSGGLSNAAARRRVHPFALWIVGSTGAANRQGSGDELRCAAALTAGGAGAGEADTRAKGDDEGSLMADGQMHNGKNQTRLAEISLLKAKIGLDNGVHLNRRREASSDAGLDLAILGCHAVE